MQTPPTTPAEFKVSCEIGKLYPFFHTYADRTPIAGVTVAPGTAITVFTAGQARELAAAFTSLADKFDADAAAEVTE